MTAPQTPDSTQPTGSASGNPRMLALATAGFAINFWAWALLGPLGPRLREELGLTIGQQAMVVAVPVIVGSLGRIPVGALTDRLGARLMFPLVSVLTVVPVLYLGHVADSYAELIAGGVFLGLGGTTFAIGIPFVNSWYPPQRRGTALGLFGAGMGGTAIAAFTTVPLVENVGEAFPFDLVAVVLVVYAIIAAVLLRDLPGRTIPSGNLASRTVATLKVPATIPLALLYAVSFGGFVAFSVYLPTYLRNAFELSQSDAAFRTAGFVVLAVVMRPIGGWLSDRYSPERVLRWVFGVVTVLALVAALELDLIPIGTIAFLGMAGALGAGAGGVFALVARLVPPEKVGAVTGVVGAAGGLGGFFPPLVMGAVYSATDSYAWGYVLLALTAAVALVYTAFFIHRRASSTSGAGLGTERP